MDPPKMATGTTSNDGTHHRTIPVIKMITRDPNNSMSDVDWSELREFLKTASKQHDEQTAFSQDHLGLTLLVEMMIDMYDAGRRHAVPRQWEDAYKTMLGRRDPDFQAHLARKRQVILDQAKYNRLETLDMQQLTDGPMHKFLKKRQKVKK
jgi:hypothetical protein